MDSNYTRAYYNRGTAYAANKLLDSAVPRVMRVIGDRLVDDLYGHDPVKHGVPGPVDGPLAASGYPLKDFVSAYSLEHRCCRGL